MAAMDIKSIKEQALAETARILHDRLGVVPDPDSEEWEDEYRRQFELLKKQAARAPSGVVAKPQAAPVDEREDDLPAMTGAPADKRWASALRSERLKQVPNKDVRAWLAGAWIVAKEWVDTRDLPPEAFLRRVEAQHAAHRKRSAAEAGLVEASRRDKAAAESALQQQVRAAGITAQGLIELIDVSARIAPAPLRSKLAELEAQDRVLRIFETAKPEILMVLEKRANERSEYAIERDEGLVADLKLYAQTKL
jgi:hypothetical protein